MARQKRRRAGAVDGLARLVALATCAALVPSPWMPTVARDGSWRQAVERLIGEKILAEGCASVVKGSAVGNPMARVQGERLYVRAKADADGLIALLVADLAADRSPADSPLLEQRLAAVPKQRHALCRHVELAVGGAAQGHDGRSPSIDPLGHGAGEDAGSLVGAAVALWTAYRRADAAQREAIDVAIMAGRWRPYVLVPAP